MTREPAAADLTGCCVLIVEDQFLLADEMQHAVERLGGPPPGPMLLVSIASIILLLTGGLFYFRRMEKTFADLI